MINGFATFLQDEHHVLLALLGARASISDPQVLNQILKSARQLQDSLQKTPTADQVSSILPAIARVVLGSEKMQIELKPKQLILLLMGDALALAGSVEDVRATHSILVPLAVKRRGVETRLLIGGGDKRPSITILTWCEASLTHEPGEALASGAVTSSKEIALAENIPVFEVSRQLPLAFLSPTIVEFILQGRQPIALTAKGLQRLSDLPLVWDLQAHILGFSDISKPGYKRSMKIEPIPSVGPENRQKR